MIGYQDGIATRERSPLGAVYSACDLFVEERKLKVYSCASSWAQ